MQKNGRIKPTNNIDVRFDYKQELSPDVLLARWSLLASLAEPHISRNVEKSGSPLCIPAPFRSEMRR